ncbi:hypothetical protein TNCT_674231 [Trichonephila clavata]|uniref:Uncharacterized protein n=1 Tax=Trichonephila clavata TaxID=2740835 RepID=A0A8X6J8D8_TRICU|nr:hypothetical protein TNCT_674231 [Trichonephila clavata]
MGGAGNDPANWVDWSTSPSQVDCEQPQHGWTGIDPRLGGGWTNRVLDKPPARWTGMASPSHGGLRRSQPSNGGLGAEPTSRWTGSKATHRAGPTTGGLGADTKTGSKPTRSGQLGIVNNLGGWADILTCRLSTWRVFC